MRLRLRWRQADLAGRASVSQQTVSDIERGHALSVGLRRLIRVAEALDADADLVVRWRGGALDRLLDERHSRLCGAVAQRLRRLGWEPHVEVSYAYYGERGSVDVLGWRPGSGLALIVEVKTELTSIEATLRKHDEKIRLAPRIARDRFGLPARAVVGLLVLTDDSTTRRRAARHAPVLEGVYPLRGRAAWAMVESPPGSAKGLVFLPPTRGAGGSRVPVTRVRLPGPLQPPRAGSTSVASAAPVSRPSTLGPAAADTTGRGRR